MKTQYRVQEYRWSEKMANPDTIEIETFDTLEKAEECYDNFKDKTVGYSLQIEELTFDEDGDLHDSEVYYESGNYEGEDITGAIIVEWSYEKHVGYARNLKNIGIAGKCPFYNFKHESDLISDNEERTFWSNYSVLVSKEDVEWHKEHGGEFGLQLKIEEELNDSHWKWNYFKNNPHSEDIKEKIK